MLLRQRPDLNGRLPCYGYETVGHKVVLDKIVADAAVGENLAHGENHKSVCITVLVVCDAVSSALWDGLSWVAGERHTTPPLSGGPPKPAALNYVCLQAFMGPGSCVRKETVACASRKPAER
jgi:hypothetical protein